jgi:hypothetical protein
LKKTQLREVMSENQIVTVQAYFAQKTGFPYPSVGIESGLHRDCIDHNPDVQHYLSLFAQPCAPINYFWHVGHELTVIFLTYYGKLLAIKRCLSTFLRMKLTFRFVYVIFLTYYGKLLAIKRCLSTFLRMRLTFRFVYF